MVCCGGGWFLVDLTLTHDFIMVSELFFSGDTVTLWIRPQKSTTLRCPHSTEFHPRLARRSQAFMLVALLMMNVVLVQLVLWSNQPGSSATTSGHIGSDWWR